MARHYLDHASTSPVRPEVIEAMAQWVSGADPGRVHTEGRMARAALEDARERVGAALGARPREVIFTSGATESINAAVFGAVAAKPGGAIVAAAVEHSAVRDASARSGAPVIEPAVDGDGRISVAEVTQAVAGRDVALANCQWGNHEVGTLQPLDAIVAACRHADALVHVDAAAAAGHVPIDFGAVGADLMSISAHKLGGPRGIGALLVRRGLRLDPFVVGGEQERARRGGMENVAAAVGFAVALEADLAAESVRQQMLTDRLRAAALSVEGVVSYGPLPIDDYPDMRGTLPHIVCLGVNGVEAEAVLLALDQAGIAAHSGSACSSESLEPSPVLAAMGVDADRSLRLSVGWSSTDADVDAFASAFPDVVARLRQMRADG
ncbi:MAG: cysteine desulfurase [Actinomycetota bacterium]|nr:cysteine desulfurase [Actinomycetota bacterium]